MGRPWKVAAAALALAMSACGDSFVPPVVATSTAVLTYYIPGQDYGAFPTYAIVSKIIYVKDTTGTPEYSFQDAPEILAAVERNMDARGYRLVARIDPSNPPPTPPAADLAMTVEVMTGTNYVFFPCVPWGWWGYPGAGCDFPWQWVAYRTGTLVIEMGNLAGFQAGPPSVIPRLWAGVGYSVLTPENAANTSIAVGAVDQAFAQSPYLLVP
jgi:hypothetical protein